MSPRQQRAWAVAVVLVLIGVGVGIGAIIWAGGEKGPSVPAEVRPGTFELKEGQEHAVYRKGTLALCQGVARRFNLSITSTWRSNSHNAEVGGVPNSMHTHGSLRNPGACDFGGTERNYQRAAAYCRNTLRAIEVLIHSVTGGGGRHLHCGFF